MPFVHLVLFPCASRLISKKLLIILKLQILYNILDNIWQCLTLQKSLTNFSSLIHTQWVFSSYCTLLCEALSEISTQGFWKYGTVFLSSTYSPNLIGFVKFDVLF